MQRGQWEDQKYAVTMKLKKIYRGLKCQIDLSRKMKGSGWEVQNCALKDVERYWEEEGEEEEEEEEVEEEEEEEAEEEEVEVEEEEVEVEEEEEEEEEEEVE